MMNKKPIEQAKNPLLGKALPALKRAALQARKTASQTGTAIIIMEDGRKLKIPMGGVREQQADYPGGDKQ